MESGPAPWPSVTAYAGPTDSPGFMFWRDFMRWQRDLNALLRPLRLTQPQFAVLAVCGWMTRNGQEVSQQQVVDFLGMDRMHISQISTRLEKDGLIRRDAAPADLRSKLLSLTDHGRDVLFRAMPIVESFDGDFFEKRKTSRE